MKLALNNDFLLEIAIKLIPILVIVFICVLLICKGYVKIRSKYNISVNCWFCNQNCKVPYLEHNSWTCTHCEQYNGFNKNGDYNRELNQQQECNVSRYSDGSLDSDDFFNRTPTTLATPQNGFCQVCNESQRLKIEKLAQFEPKNESHFDAELKVYKAQLEQQYRLCSTCERHLHGVLREKKKMVLGEKFLNFVLKGAEKMRQPHFKSLEHAQRELKKLRLSRFILLLTILHIVCLCQQLPTLRREHLTRFFGDAFSQYLFIAFSHVLALARVISAYLSSFNEHDVVLKCTLFARTLLIMFLYSLGLKLPQVINLDFSAIYIKACPLIVLLLIFAHNFLERFKLGRYTLLLGLWSVLASGLLGIEASLMHNIVMLLLSLLTLCCCATQKLQLSPKLHDASTASFHRLHTEDYFSDDETISMLSKQFNSSQGSVRSNATNRSLRSSATTARYARSPISSSLLSLNQTSCTPLSNNFKSFCMTDNASKRNHYASSVCSMPAAARASPFVSNLELNSTQRMQRPMPSPALGWNISARNANAKLNTSFTQSEYQAPSTNSHWFAQQQNAVADNTRASSALRSPFSLSSQNVYQTKMQQPLYRSSLLSPSRFSTNSLTNNDLNASTASWLYNQYAPTKQQQQQQVHQANFMHEQRHVDVGALHLPAVHENLSRSSSYSSGFESQNERINQATREHSLADPPPPPPAAAEQPFLEAHKTFQAIEQPKPHCLNTYPASQSAYSQSLYAPSPAVYLANGSCSIDSFNLRQMNDGLPPIKRGDLLKKWKESQLIS